MISPLENDQRFKPNYKQAVEKISTPPTTLFTMENIGAIHQKFKTLPEARKSVAAFEEARNRKLPLEPKVRRNKNLNKRPCIISISTDQIEEKIEGISFEDFRTLWSKARCADQEDLLTKKFFTNDKKTRSLFNFVEGADPILVFHAFNAGLVKNISLSANLQELKHFPKRMTKAIKSFGTKVLKTADQAIYINVTSSIADWSQSKNHSPYFFIEIGLAKKRDYCFSKIMTEDFPSNDDLVRIRVAGLGLIIQKICSIETDTQVKVNYNDPNCLVTS
ncbi:hypothetical protein QQ045_019698 [Rhodiola kirilowii]